VAGADRPVGDLPVPFCERAAALELFDRRLALELGAEALVVGADLVLEVEAGRPRLGPEDGAALGDEPRPVLAVEAVGLAHRHVDGEVGASGALREPLADLRLLHPAAAEVGAHRPRAIADVDPPVAVGLAMALGRLDHLRPDVSGEVGDEPRPRADPAVGLRRLVGLEQRVDAVGPDALEEGVALAAVLVLVLEVRDQVGVVAREVVEELLAERIRVLPGRERRVVEEDRVEAHLREARRQPGVDVQLPHPKARVARERCDVLVHVRGVGEIARHRPVVDEEDSVDVHRLAPDQAGTFWSLRSSWEYQLHSLRVPSSRPIRGSKSRILRCFSSAGMRRSTSWYPRENVS
jgi:hypothetical protein